MRNEFVWGQGAWQERKVEVRPFRISTFPDCLGPAWSSDEYGGVTSIADFLGEIPEVQALDSAFEDWAQRYEVLSGGLQAMTEEAMALYEEGLALSRRLAEVLGADGTVFYGVQSRYAPGMSEVVLHWERLAGHEGHERSRV